MKKLINDPADVVKEALQGVALAHADRVRVLTDPNVVVRADAPVAGKVNKVNVAHGDGVKVNQVLVEFE